MKVHPGWFRPLPVETGIERLTPQQLAALRARAAGLSNAQAARLLGIGQSTLDSYLHDAFARLGISGVRSPSLRAVYLLGRYDEQRAWIARAAATGEGMAGAASGPGPGLPESE